MKNKLIYIEIVLLSIAIIIVSIGIVRILIHPKATINYVVKNEVNYEPREVQIMF